MPRIVVSGGKGEEAMEKDPNRGPTRKKAGAEGVGADDAFASGRSHRRRGSAGWPKKSSARRAGNADEAFTDNDSEKTPTKGAR